MAKQGTIPKICQVETDKTLGFEFASIGWLQVLHLKDTSQSSLTGGFNSCGKIFESQIGSFPPGRG